MTKKKTTVTDIKDILLKTGEEIDSSEYATKIGILGTNPKTKKGELKKFKENYGYSEEKEVTDKISKDDFINNILPNTSTKLSSQTIQSIECAWQIDNENIYVILDNVTTNTSSNLQQETHKSLYIFKCTCTIKELNSELDGTGVSVDKELVDYKTSTAAQLQSSISTWYKTLRLIAIVGLLSVLVYVGIRILISSTGQEKAKYKKMLTDWVAAMCILFLLQYVMVFTMEMTENITEIFASKNSTGLFEADGSDRLISTVRGQMKSDKTNGYENASFMEMFSWLIIYIVLVIYTCVFVWQYLKRVVMLAFLTMIAPLIALTYPLDKIKDGQAQAFSMWLREYIFNALLPVIHVIIYYMLISSAIDFITTGGNWLYAIVAVGFMIPAEKFFRKMFGFDKASSVGQLGAAAGGAMVMNAINKMKTGGSGGGTGGNSGDSKPVRPRYIPGPGEGRTQTETGQRTSGGRNPAGTQPGDSAGGNTVPGAPEVPQNGGAGTNPSGSTPIDSGSTETGAGSATTGGSMFGESVLGTPEKPTIRKAGFNRVISGVAANAHQRYFNKQNAKKWGRRARKGAVKTLGAAALGTFGLAAGIASGDPTNAFKYGAAAAAVGAKGADTLDEKAMKSAKENKEGIQENILGTSAFNMNKATKELNSDLDFVRTCDELGMTKKEREEAVRQFHANGITNAEDIKNAMDIRVKNKEEGENVSQKEIIAATKLHKKLGKSYWGQPANQEKFKKELIAKGSSEAQANKAIRLISDLKGDLS